MGISSINAYSGGILGMMFSAGPMAKLVIFILLVFSIISWTIILFKWRQLNAANRDGTKFLKMARDADSFKRLTGMYTDDPDSPFYKLLLGSYKEFSLRQKENLNPVDSLPAVENILKVTTSQEAERLEKKISFLATTANTAPFIGLFGTVWGIIDSFREIGLRGTTSLAVVAPGISEALIATALGLFAAIPAVLGYNVLVSKLRSVSSKMEHASAYIINLISR
jgi:biopolymer transport protein TolQ